MDNVKEPYIVKGDRRPLYVCIYCGPESLAYSGRIIGVICDQCKRERAAVETR